MIVKVQVPILGNTEKLAALIYNKNRSVQTTMSLSKEIIDMMDGRLKAYFNAKMDGTILVLGKEARKQNW